MRTTMRITAILAVALLAACGGSREGGRAPDELRLSPGESRIWFIGTKNNAVAVPGYFAVLSGSLSLKERKATIESALGSVDTGDTERDMNIRVHLFQAEEHPKARFEVDELEGAGSLPNIGESVEAVARGTLQVSKARVELRVPVRITREGSSRIRVTTTEPFILTADELGMSKQFKILKAVCGHSSLSSAVPVQVDLVFEGS